MTSSGVFGTGVRNGDSMRGAGAPPPVVTEPVTQPSPVEATVLGKKVEYKFEYDPKLLASFFLISHLYSYLYFSCNYLLHVEYV